MSDLKTTEEISRNILDGTELVRLATTGANWKTTLSSIFRFLWRETLTLDRVYYVNNVTGSDSNDGLTLLTPFRTIQYAANLISNKLYLQNAAPSIQCVTTGVDYNEWLCLRPWQGSIPGNSTSGFEGCIAIKGDATNGGLVKIKPVGVQPTSYLVDAAVEARGVGAWWSLVDITVDGSGATGVAQQACVYAIDGAKMHMVGGGIGGNTDSVGTGIAQIGAENNSLFRWDSPSVGSSHVFGNAHGGIFALSDHNSELIINNSNLVWDNDPGYFAVLFSAVNSKIMYYHNFAFSGTALVGCYKYWLQDCCQGSTSILDTSLPGNLTGQADGTSHWRSISIRGPFTFAQLSTIGSPGHTFARVTDSNTTISGATVAGGGANNVLAWYDGTNWIVVGGSSGSAGIVVGTSTITGGTTKHVPYNLAGVYQEAANFTIESSNPNVIAGGAYKYANTNAIIADPPNGNWHIAGAGNLTMTGTANLSMGGSSLAANTAGTQNLAFGAGAMVANTTGSLNVAIGPLTLATATAAGRCLAIGANAMISATGGNDNVGFGFQALGSNTSGGNNIGIGANALGSNSTGGANNAVGFNALTANTFGANNSADGSGALSSNTTGNRNMAIGSNAMLQSIDGSDNLCVGANAGFTLLHGFENVLMGANAASAGGDGNLNVGLGSRALYTLNAGTENTCVGPWAGNSITSGSQNIILGTQYGFGSNITTGSNNVSIGQMAYVATATASDQLNIQNIIYGTGNAGVRGTASTGKIGIGLPAPACKLDVDGEIKTKGYTVAGLPAAGVTGRCAYVTDSAAAPVFMAVVAAGGTTKVPVFDNGTNWVYG